MMIFMHSWSEDNFNFPCMQTELGNIRSNMQGELSNSESNRDFAECELQVC